MDGHAVKATAYCNQETTISGYLCRFGIEVIRALLFKNIFPLNMYKISVLWLVFFWASSLKSVQAQQTTQQRSSWFTYFAQYKFTPQWGIHFDAQFRMDENVQRSNQSLLRVGLQYYPKKNMSVTLGFASIETFNKGFDLYVPEKRIWEQFLVNHPIGQFNMTHRFRLEQRFIDRYVRDNNNIPVEDGRNMGHRFRYFNRTLWNLTPKEKKSVLYAALQEEMFFNFAADAINKNTFDQNRLLLAFGVWHDHHTRLELGYMNLLSNPASGANVSNHIVHFSVLQVLDFGK